MISRIELRNWRAYEHLELELPGGAVFVVSRNGVGKTSLVMGASWALFGEDYFPIKPERYIRVGAQEALASVELVDLQGNRHVFTRTVQRSGGKTSLTITTPKSQPAKTFEDLIRDEMGADPSFLARACILREGTASALMDGPALDVYEHLCQVFGVSNLLTGKKALAPLTRKYASASKDQRKDQRQDIASVAAARERLTRLSDQESELSLKQESARTAYEKALRSEAIQSAWTRHEELLRERNLTLQELLGQSSRVLGEDPATEHQLQSLLTARAGSLQREASEVNRTIAELQARLALIQQLSSQLGEAHRDCPLCLRPLENKDIERASKRHGSEITKLHDQIERLQQERDTIEKSATDVRRMQERLWALPRLVPPNQDHSQLSRLDIDEARNALDLSMTQSMQLKEEKGRLSQTLDLDQMAKDESLRLFRSYRQEALVAALSSAADELIREILGRHIDPLREELSGRWKLIWQRETAPISFSERGELKMNYGEHEVQFSEFSGGERLLALLLLQLLTVRLTTSARFCWLDEPLEHLDPRNRRLVASLLTQSATSGQFDQILATTYEEASARRIAELVEDAHIIYVTAGT